VDNFQEELMIRSERRALTALTVQWKEMLVK